MDQIGARDADDSGTACVAAALHSCADQTVKQQFQLIATGPPVESPRQHDVWLGEVGMRNSRWSLALAVVSLTALGRPEATWAQKTPVCTFPPTNPAVVLNGKDYSSFFTQSANAFSAPTVNAFGVSASASEASTSQFLELISQRRLQESQACPTGFVRVSGVCQPQTNSKKAAKKKTTAASTADRSSLGMGEADGQPLALDPAFAVWTEAFADYEKRTGDKKQSQKTIGSVFGFDHTSRVGGWGVQLGLIGGYTHARRTNDGASRTETQDANFDVFVRNQVVDPNLPVGPPDNQGAIFRYTLPTEHTIDSSSEETLNGLNLGFSAAFFRGGFFADFLFKVDFFDLKRVDHVSDTFGRTLNAAFIRANDSFDPGCISTSFSNPAFPYFQILDPATTVSSSRDQTTLRNFTVANSIGQRFELKNGIWFEPSGSIRFAYSDYGNDANILGLKDGYALRLEVGGKVGSASALNRDTVWINAIGAYVYSDVLVNGLVVASTGSSTESDEGRLRVRGVVQSRLEFSNGTSVYAEFGARGGEDYWGYGGKLGGRVEW
jgi:hypothetical protein